MAPIPAERADSGIKDGGCYNYDLRRLIDANKRPIGPGDMFTTRIYGNEFGLTASGGIVLEGVWPHMFTKVLPRNRYAVREAEIGGRMAAVFGFQVLLDSGGQIINLRLNGRDSLNFRIYCGDSRFLTGGDLADEILSAMGAFESLPLNDLRRLFGENGGILFGRQDTLRPWVLSEALLALPGSRLRELIREDSVQGGLLNDVYYVIPRSIRNEEYRWDFQPRHHRAKEELVKIWSRAANTNLAMVLMGP